MRHIWTGCSKIIKNNNNPKHSAHCIVKGNLKYNNNL